MSSYDPHQAFIDSARSSAGLPRLAAGVLLFVIAFIAFTLALFQVVAHFANVGIFTEINKGTTPRGILIMLGSFTAMVAGIWIAVRVAHGRGLLSLVGPIQPAVRDFFRVFIGGVLLMGVVMLIPMPEGLQPQSNLGFGPWLVWLPIALTCLIIQVSAEELVFRGYLQSQLAARFSHPAIWMGLPSVVFGFLHLSPAVYGDNAVFIAIWAIAFGFAAADLTARVGNLGAAIGLHFANNIFAVLLVGLSGYGDGLALLVMPFGPEDGDALRSALMLEGPVLLCLWLVARIAIRR